MRGWHIGQYNFDDYGEEHGNPRWTERIHLNPGESVHQDKVSPDYYIDRLGPSEEQAEKIRDHFKWRNEREKEMHDIDASSVPEVTVEEKKK